MRFGRRHRRLVGRRQQPPRQPDGWRATARLTTDPQHVRGGLVELDEDTVVDLTEPEKLEHLLDLGGHLVDTADTDDKGQLGLGGHVEVALLLSLPLQPKNKKRFQVFLST